jgi:hypothetical protein
MQIGMPRSKTGTSRDLVNRLTKVFHIEDRTGVCQRKKIEQIKRIAMDSQKYRLKHKAKKKKKGTDRKRDWAPIRMSAATVEQGGLFLVTSTTSGRFR